MNPKQKRVYMIVRCLSDERELFKKKAWEERLTLTAWVIKNLKKVIAK